MRISKDKKLLLEHKNKYIIKEIPYPTGTKLELWKKNPRGFYNVICYLNSKSEMDDAILNDIKKRK